jgi:hypothetical protein
LYLIEPDPAGFKQLAAAQVLAEGQVNDADPMTRFGGGNQNWAPLALSDGKLLIRDQTKMICVKVAQ